MALVMQDVFLLLIRSSTTSHYTIQPFRKKKLWRQRKQLGFTNLLCRPNGYDYNVQERGVMLSADSTTYCILRAYLASPAILVLMKRLSMIRFLKN